MFPTWWRKKCKNPSRGTAPRVALQQQDSYGLWFAVVCFCAKGHTGSVQMERSYFPPGGAKRVRNPVGAQPLVLRCNNRILTVSGTLDTCSCAKSHTGSVRMERSCFPPGGAKRVRIPLGAQPLVLRCNNRILTVRGAFDACSCAKGHMGSVRMERSCSPPSSAKRVRNPVGAQPLPLLRSDVFLTVCGTLDACSCAKGHTGSVQMERSCSPPGGAKRVRNPVGAQPLPLLRSDVFLTVSGTLTDCFAQKVTRARCGWRDRVPHQVAQKE